MWHASSRTREWRSKVACNCARRASAAALFSKFLLARRRVCLLRRTIRTSRRPRACAVARETIAATLKRLPQSSASRRIAGRFGFCRPPEITFYLFMSTTCTGGQDIHNRATGGVLRALLRQVEEEI